MPNIGPGLGQYYTKIVNRHELIWIEGCSCFSPFSSASGYADLEKKYKCGKYSWYLLNCKMQRLRFYFNVQLRNGSMVTGWKNRLRDKIKFWLSYTAAAACCVFVFCLWNFLSFTTTFATIVMFFFHKLLVSVHDSRRIHLRAIELLWAILYKVWMRG